MHTASFQNCAETVIDFLDATQHTLIIGICWFTHPFIFQALQKASTRNVKVTLLLNYDNINFQPRGLDFLALEKSGALVMAYTGPGLLHYKFAVADGCRLLSGSYNWTRAEQCDHVSIVHDEALATQFIQAFEEMMNGCKPLAQLRNTPPRPCSFQELYFPMLWSSQDLRRSVIAGAKTWIVLAKTEQEWARWVSGQRHDLFVKFAAGEWPCKDVLDDSALRRWFLETHLRPSVRTLLTRYGLRVRIGDIFIAISSSSNPIGAGIVGADMEMRAGAPGVASRYVQWLELKTPVMDTNFSLRLPVKRYTGSALALIAKLELSV